MGDPGHGEAFGAFSAGVACGNGEKNGHKKHKKRRRMRGRDDAKRIGYKSHGQELDGRRVAVGSWRTVSRR